MNQASAQSNTLELTDAEKAWISENPVIRISNPSAIAPFIFTQNGVVEGFAFDYISLLASKVNLKIEFPREEPWNNMMEKLRNKEIDLIHSAAFSDERAEWIEFTDPYLDIPLVNAGRDDGAPIIDEGDLVGKRIGLMKGYTTSEQYKQYYPDLEFFEYDRIEEALRALSASQIDVFTGNLITINYATLKYFIPNISIIGWNTFLVTNNIRHRLGALKENKILINILSKAMKMVSNNEFIALSEKWQTVINEQDNNIGLTEEEVNWLAEHKVIRTAFDPTLVPLVFVGENGDIDGIAGDYFKLISEKLNIKFKWIENKTFSEGYERTLNGEADLLALLSVNDERKEHFSFTDSYINLSQMIFARKDTNIYNNMDALEGAKIAGVDNYFITLAIERDYPDLEIVKTSSVLEALTLLSTGEVDAYVGNLPVANYITTSVGLSNIIVVGETNYRTINSIAVRSELPLLASAINKALASISVEERSIISRSWIGLRTNATIDYSLVWRIIGAASLIILFFAIWTKKLKEAQEKAVSANNAKSAFLANMSHEIRTPLNAIMGFSDAMLAGVGGEVTNKKHQEYLTDIRNSGAHLATVINDILDLSRIESGKMVLKESDFSLNDCINDAIKMVSPRATSKNILISNNLTDKIKMHGDEHCLKRVFINLLSNAVKFTIEDGSIEFVVLRTPKNEIKIEIIDDGIGIPEDRIDEVLKPFEQSQNDHELDEEGTGLGLPIVVFLVEKHGGTFSLSSEYGLGTCATIYLPSKRVLN